MLVGLSHQCYFAASYRYVESHVAAVWPWAGVAVLNKHDWSAPTSGSLSLTEIKKSRCVGAGLVSGYGFHLSPIVSADSAVVSPCFRDRVSCMLILSAVLTPGGLHAAFASYWAFPVTETHLVSSVLLFYEDGNLQIGLSCSWNCPSYDSVYKVKVKMKFSLFAPWGTWDSGVTTPLILNLGTRWRWVST